MKIKVTLRWGACYAEGEHTLCGDRHMQFVE